MEAGRVIADRYQLERPLAEGGMGTVWIARHLELGTRVAVKFMDPKLTASTELRVRFEREAKSAANIKSANVVAIHDYGLVEGAPFIAMELLEGEDLGDAIERERRLAIADVERIVVQVCKALSRAHALGIVHRDLKPENIFLAGDEDDVVVKLLDFGIAKTTEQGAVPARVTTAQAVFGSPAYMSPEQARGAANVDPRTDLWSLAVVAYESMTGVLPFEGESGAETIAKILRDAAPPPSTLVSGLPLALDTFFERALARDLDTRFPNAREFSAAFRAACGSLEAVSQTSHPGVRDEPSHERDDARTLPRIDHRLRDSAQTAAPGVLDVTPLISPRGRWALGGAVLVALALGAFLAFRAVTPEPEAAPAAPSIADATPTVSEAPPPPPATASASAPVSSASASAAPPKAAPRAPGRLPGRAPTQRKSDELGF